MTLRHLILLLDAPLMSFGAEAVDAQGVIRDFPARSAITGLLANALGWERENVQWLDELQDRIIFGAALLEQGVRIKDFQTAKLGINDRGWTTRGAPEGRTGSPATYHSPHLRHRYADAETRAIVAFRVAAADRGPDLDQLSEALDRPERPLFIGRKPFIPSTRLLYGDVEAGNVLEALASAIASAGKDSARAQWPLAEGQEDGSVVVEFTDERNWRTGVHAGLRRVREGMIFAGSSVS